uniref:Ovule protein n=1 Tax=Haemonchus placei TaxID=6290 RepID=A0A0N4WFM0_HAEPC
LRCIQIVSGGRRDGWIMHRRKHRSTKIRSLFGILTVCDKSLEKMPLYYDLKLLLALLLFVEPCRLVDRIKDLLQTKNKQESRIFNEKEMGTFRKSTGSPRPERP